MQLVFDKSAFLSSLDLRYSDISQKSTFFYNFSPNFELYNNFCHGPSQASAVNSRPITVAIYSFITLIELASTFAGASIPVVQGNMPPIFMKVDRPWYCHPNIFELMSFILSSNSNNCCLLYFNANIMRSFREKSFSKYMYSNRLLCKLLLT